MLVRTMRKSLISGISSLLVFAIAAPAPAAPQKPAARISDHLNYNRDIRPILSDNCFSCHGPDKNQRQANLRLDRKESAYGLKAVVPGDPEKSSLVARINAGSSALLMPPEKSHKKLTPEQRALLVRWIKEGAEYQPHWAYIAPHRPPVPAVVKAKSRIQNPIDAFLFARLEQKGFLPSPEADRRTLLRRLSLDLTGIPPAPSEISAFLADNAPDAYEKQVDRLLRSPHYGERMAVPWLDVIRYADTVGFHGDQNQNAWAYRDYVINAFNRNKPFDQFTIEQIAGDLIPNPTPESLTATCANRLNMVTREGGAQAKEYLAKYAADRVRTVGMAWLGSTLACCECHDHKYDPFTARDFYSMAAFYSDVRQWGVYADYGYTPNPDLRGYNNDYPFPPEIKVESAYLKQRIARAQEQMRRIALAAGPELAADPAKKAAFEAWRSDSFAFLGRNAEGWESSPASAQAAKPASGGAANVDAISVAQRNPDGSLLLTSAAPAGIALHLKPQTERIASLRLDLIPTVACGGSILRDGVPDKMGGAGTLTVTASILKASGQVSPPLVFRYASANYAQPRYSNGFEVPGIQAGWRLSEAHAKEQNTSVWLLSAPVRMETGDTFVLSLQGVKLGCVKVAVSPFTPDSPDSPAMAAGLADALQHPDDPAKRPLALLAYQQSTHWDPAAQPLLMAQEKEIIACRRGITPVMVTEATAPALTRVLPRGNWQDETGAVVTPSPPEFLSASLKQTPGQRLTRLDLAKWIVSPDNPLTARVQVNRFWKQFFGAGLSDQVEDLGSQGEWPTHPELLDWLAVEFRESGWDVRHMVRLIVLSSAYRQSSRLRTDLRAIDPANRLLGSQNPRRLDAEFVRDNALAIAGLLDADIGGPPCKPYQPAGYYANIQFPDRSYVPDADERQWRRGLYMHWQRTFLHPMLANFGAPSREDCIASRTVTNTPQQALTLLNDPEFVEAARQFAARLLPFKSDAERLDQAYQLALSRAPKPKEKESLLAFLKSMREEYSKRPDDAKKLLAVGIVPAPATADPIELAAWTSVCRVLLNLHETITRY